MTPIQRVIWLGGLDSNQDSQLQRLMYYRLYDLPAEGKEMGRGEPRILRGFATQLLYCRQENEFRQPRGMPLRMVLSQLCFPDNRKRVWALLACPDAGRGARRYTGAGSAWSPTLYCEADGGAYNGGIPVGETRIEVDCEGMT